MRSLFERGRLYAPITLAFLVLTVVAGSVPQAAAQQFRPNPASILIASGPIGGGWYATGAALGDILMESIPGLTATVTEGGGPANIRDVSRGSAHLGYVFSHTFADALRGEEPFPQPVNNVYAVASLYVSYLQSVVLADSEIRSYTDLPGKRLLPGRVNWSGEILARQLLGIYGWDYDHLRRAGGSVSFTGFTEMTQLLRDRHADIALAVTAAPSAFIMDLNATHDIRFIAMDEDTAQRMLEKYPGYAYVEMPANTYEGQTEPVPTLGSYTMIFASDQLSEEMVYHIVKAIADNVPRLQQAHPDLAGFTLESMLEGIRDFPIHPGVKRFLREQGIEL